MINLTYLKMGLTALLISVIVFDGYVIYSRGITIDELKVENSELTERLSAQEILLTELNTRTNALKEDLKVAQEASQQVRIVTETRVQKIYQASVPEDCSGSLDFLSNQMQQTLKGRTK